MADNSTFITGAAEGAFVDALSGIPPWATQKTAQDIEKLLKQLLGVQSKALTQAINCCKAAGGDGSTSSKDVQNELDKLHKTVNKLNEEDEKALKRKKKEDKEEKERDKKRGSAGQLWNMTLSALVGAGTKLLGVQKQYFITSEELFKSGVNLLNGNESDHWWLDFPNSEI